ncbi:ribonuclease III [Colletotrichum chrysophilum]|uniref:Ribonuclease III n=1 Tax=Colletotrichum chrysophilum TaxID=1836956 RepID=A0AAD9AZY6_9PEZI|nr:ribonuclease III [Colletotrichum chrysophilum]
MGDYLYNRKQKEDEVMAIIDYEFQDRDRLWEALQGKGSLVTQIGGRPVRDNRMLAMVGDKIVGLIIIRNENRDGRTIAGQATTRVAELACDSRLVALCDNTGLTQWINGSPFNGGLVSKDNKAATIEAIVGAVFEDAGEAVAKRVMENMGIIERTASEPV